MNMTWREKLAMFGVVALTVGAMVVLTALLALLLFGGVCGCDATFTAPGTLVIYNGTQWPIDVYRNGAMVGMVDSLAVGRFGALAGDEFLVIELGDTIFAVHGPLIYNEPPNGLLTWSVFPSVVLP